uniref:Uncharacterized protein n=1 Tax=Rhizophora mucronata TaxID=61149 RepID=A0A2P2IIX0_RHIMU
MHHKKTSIPRGHESGGHVL